MKALYINPFTDFGFKKIFAEEASKPLLLDFLNALLPKSIQIADISFKKTEQLGQTETDRKAIYDIYCENDQGEKFIVELQKAKQNHFKERTIYYSTFPIREQAEKGDWNYDLKAVYCIGILDFTFDDYLTETEKKEVVHTIQLKNQHGRVFYDKLYYIYLEMPNFKKTEAELETRLDKWLFFIKHLEDLRNIPAILNDDIFTTAFEKAAIANMNQADLEAYEMNLKTYRDLKNIIDYSYQEGRIEGKLEGINEGIEKGERRRTLKIACALKQNGVPIDIISLTTGLTVAQIEELDCSNLN